MRHRTSDRILTPFAIALAIALFLIVSVAHNGLVLAIVQEASETPIDTPTAEAFTETPTETPTDAPTDAPTQTPIIITATPEPPTETPLPTDTLAPTETTPPTETTIPTDTPEPTETPLPTALPTPTPPVEPPDDDVPPVVVRLSLEQIIVLVIAIGALVWSLIQSRNIKDLDEWRRINRARVTDLETLYQGSDPTIKTGIDTATTISDSLDNFIKILEPLTRFFQDIQTPGTPAYEAYVTPRVREAVIEAMAVKTPSTPFASPASPTDGEPAG